MRRVFPVFLTLLIPVLFCGTSVSISYLINNFYLNKFASNLYSYPLPPQTQFIDSHAEVTLLGNGNHCDFVVKQFLTTQLSRSEVESYYENVRLPAVKKRSQTDEPDLVMISLEFNEQRATDKQLQFTISLTDLGYSPLLDIRCN
jgi:hypothetical protein